MNPLQEAFQYYIAHQAELVAQYADKVIVIKDGQVLGVFEDEGLAVREAAKMAPIGSFLVQRVSAGNAGYSQTFHSRVAFA